MLNPIQILTTTDSLDSAESLVRQLVEERLIACGQIDGPIRSTYRWQGSVENASEYRCTLKTDARLWEKVVPRIESLHHYEVPEIIATELPFVSAAYRNWMLQQMKDGLLEEGDS